ncbi:GSCFA domain-containing protein [Carboxylicivirga sp. N1Y90]|uniref:GSCFA domain-containing protein n=1 Tax=Carboxylicivirga fragile TaxID=3417571 RepID=UPI003D32B62E|nr:GSCFA domain-containing protein [Marinilabiliaceae bacterium N1Y90]
MDNFRTEIEPTPSDSKLSYDAHMFFMGSCFATNIGAYFQQTQFNALVNPFGVLYNPFSIANALDRMMDEDGQYKKSDLSFNNGLWQSFDHHGQFNEVDADACLNGINESLLIGHDFLKKANILFITFGTAWVYQLAESEKIVSNCHKFPASHFNRFLSKVDDIVGLYERLVLRLKEFNPSIKIVLTISPVRHWKDGAHGNQLSKSILHLAADSLVNRFDNITYFPAYELLLDDLRDYRFYADDLLHPSKLAIEYIKNKYIEAWLDDDAKQFIKRISKLNKALAHRPFNKSTEAYSQFIKKTATQLKSLQKEYSNISLNKMTDYLPE